MLWDVFYLVAEMIENIACPPLEGEIILGAVYRYFIKNHQIARGCCLFCGTTYPPAGGLSISHAVAFRYATKKTTALCPHTSRAVPRSYLSSRGKRHRKMISRHPWREPLSVVLRGLMFGGSASKPNLQTHFDTTWSIKVLHLLFELKYPAMRRWTCEVYNRFLYKKSRH